MVICSNVIESYNICIELRRAMEFSNEFVEKLGNILFKGDEDKC